MRRLLYARFAVGGLLTLAACGGDDTVPVVSAECDAAMERAASEVDPTRADPLIIETLSTCQDADEWLAALREHPGALGRASRADVDDSALHSACLDPADRDTPVCRDAAVKGRL